MQPWLRLSAALHAAASRTGGGPTGGQRAAVPGSRNCGGIAICAGLSSVSGSSPGGRCQLQQRQQQPKQAGAKQGQVPADVKQLATAADPPFSILVDSAIVWKNC